MEKKYQYLKIELKFNTKNSDQVKLYRALKARTKLLKKKNNKITTAGEIKSILFHALFNKHS